MGFIRPPAVAGSFYPADPSVLAAEMRHLLAQAATGSGDAPKALIVPHAGLIYSGPIAATAYARLLPARERIKRVVLIGPAHRVAFTGVAASTASAFQTPLGAVMLADPRVLQGIEGVGSLDQAHAEEHSLEVHLPFLQTLFDDFTLLPLVAGNAPDRLVARVLESVWGGPETLVVVSSDLSHYLDYDGARTRDRATHDAIMRLDADAFDHDGACGRTPLGGLLTVSRQRGLAIESLDLRNSGDTAGPRDRVVGYGAWALHEPDRSRLPGLLLRLASQTIASRLGLADAVDALPHFADLQAIGASFVTLRRQGALRGCIGSMIGWRPLALDVADNALKAAFNDPRFPPLAPAEWPEITLSLSLLSPPAPFAVRDQSDLLAQLRPHIDGLVLQEGERSALFLPAVWEQLPDADQFLAHLKQKAGLPPDYWSPTLTFARFTADEYHAA